MNTDRESAAYRSFWMFNIQSLKQEVSEKLPQGSMHSGELMHIT